MRFRAVATAAGAFAFAVTMITGTPAGAQEEPPPIEVSPGSGAPGSVITVTGTGCEHPASAGAELWDTVTGRSVEIAFTPGTADGIWTVDLTVPADRVAGEVLELRSWCELAPGDNWEYARVDFPVVDPLPDLVPIAVDPTSGPIGTTVSVSGTECTGDAVEFALLAGQGLEDISAIVDAWSTAPADDGSWSGELTVYDTMIPAEGQDEIDVVPGDDYFVAAACAFYPDDVPDAPSPDHIIFSEAIDFEITGDGTAPRTDAPPETVIVPVVEAQPATAVVADPRYTG